MIHITSSDYEMINVICTLLAKDCEVFAFGSRVKGTHHKNSDLDLCFVGKEPLGWFRRGRLKDAFCISDITFRVDVVDYNACDERFRAVIDADKEPIFPVCAALADAGTV